MYRQVLDLTGHRSWTAQHVGGMAKGGGRHYSRTSLANNAATYQMGNERGGAIWGLISTRWMIGCLSSGLNSCVCGLSYLQGAGINQHAPQSRGACMVWHGEIMADSAEHAMGLTYTPSDAQGASIPQKQGALLGACRGSSS